MKSFNTNKPRIRPGAKALIVHNGKVLVIKEKIGDRIIHDFPGGGLEFGESPEEALVREVYEEIGITVIPERLVGTWDFLIRENSVQVLCIGYQCRVEGELRFDFSRNPAEEDIFDHLWVSPDELIKNGEKYFAECMKMLESVKALEVR